MRFHDRAHAGKLLAEELRERGVGCDALLALPRGGVPIAQELALSLQVPLQVLIVRKLGVPDHPELAMGAIAEGGIRVINDRVVRAHGITDDVLRRVEEREQQELALRRELYGGRFDSRDYVDATVVVVDDGIATGATMKAAVEAVEYMGAHEVIIAIPVAAGDVIEMFEDAGFRCVCPLVPDDLRSVSQWYENFEQVSDEAVNKILAEEMVKRRQWPSHPLL